MDRAIKEIVPGIVQRSVSIATQTTKELVVKVLYATELCVSLGSIELVNCLLLLLLPRNV